MKILLLGKNSFVGDALCTEINANLVDYNIVALSSKECDVRVCSDIERAINKYKPYVVVSSYCIKGISNCADNFKDTFEVNTKGVHNVSTCCYSHDIKHIYISTDLVFGNEKCGRFTYDIPTPVNSYGWTKRMGELATLDLGGIVVRVARVYGKSQKECLFNSVLNSLKEGKQITLYADMYDRPTHIKDVVKMLTLNSSGYYHITGNDFVSRYAFGRRIAEIFGYDKKLIKKTNLNINKKQTPCLEFYPTHLNIVSSLDTLGITEGLKILEQGL